MSRACKIFNLCLTILWTLAAIRLKMFPRSNILRSLSFFFFFSEPFQICRKKRTCNFLLYWIEKGFESGHKFQVHTSQSDQQRFHQCSIVWSIMSTGAVQYKGTSVFTLKGLFNSFMTEVPIT